MASIILAIALAIISAVPSAALLGGAAAANKAIINSMGLRRAIGLGRMMASAE
jgi:hypothetical protein